MKLHETTVKLLDHKCPAYLTKPIIAAMNQITDPDEAELIISALCGAGNWAIKTDIQADYTDEVKGGPAHRAEYANETAARMVAWATAEAYKAR